MDVNKAAWVEIDTKALSENVNIIRNQLGDRVKLCAIVKGDAYGHSIKIVKPFLEKNRLVYMVACGTVFEMEKIFKETGVGMEVLLLGSPHIGELEEAYLRGFINPEKAIISVCGIKQFYELSALAKKLGKTIRVHLRADEYDSGMGIGYDECLSRLDEFFSCKEIDICGLYGHLYTSYDMDSSETKRELEAFDNFVKSIDSAMRKRLTIHVQNSPMVFRFPEYSYDMARVGTAIYGLPSGDNNRLKPVMRICGRIFSVTNVDARAPLSYTESNAVSKKIARIMLGYADCPLLLTQKDIRVAINGKLYSMADEVCMDNMCVDITGSEDIKVGDKAVILGTDGIRAEDITERNGLKIVHSDWMLINASRLWKVEVE